jgi:hypothetical protein
LHKVIGLVFWAKLLLVQKWNLDILPIGFLSSRLRTRAVEVTIVKGTKKLINLCCVLLTGPGCFIQSVEALSGRKAVVAGKPSLLMKEFITKRHPINPERTIIIGDT